MSGGRILVVGAGFAGALHARELAEAGFDVDVIDRRPHLGGNAYDEVSDTGVRVHCYGPHLFHTNNETVVRWLRRFAEFVPYEHRVQALLADGRCVPLPINRDTINAVFGVRLDGEQAVRDFLRGQAQPNPSPANAAEFLNATIGPVLTDLLFRPYTSKMWGLELEQIDVSVVKRIPVRFDNEDRYFPGDRFQLLPKLGYTRLFENILDHDRISLTLGAGFDARLLADHDHCFNSMPIDEFFDCRFGPLPYRSIRFHHETLDAECRFGQAATLNYTDDGKLTRQTDWSRLPGHVTRPSHSKIITREEPCDYTQNNHERYYPVKTSDGRYQVAYERYRTLARQWPKVSFIGRCGTYQYLDMHQVISQSMTHVRGWIAAHARVQ